MSASQSGGRVAGIVVPAIIGLLLAGLAAFGVITAATGAQGDSGTPNEVVRQYGEN